MLSEHVGTFGLLVKLGALQYVVGVVMVKLYEYETGAREAPGPAVMVMVVIDGTAAEYLLSAMYSDSQDAKLSILKALAPPINMTRLTSIVADIIANDCR
jgi:hypothetical protein